MLGVAIGRFVSKANLKRGGVPGLSQVLWNSIAASQEFWMASRAKSVASSDGALIAMAPGFFTATFLNSFDKSPRRSTPVRVGLLPLPSRHRQ